MARGFLSGMVIGGVLSLAVAGVASVVAPPPMPPVVSDAAPGVAEAPERIAQGTSGEAATGGDRAPVTGQVAPQAPEPEADRLALETGTTVPAAQPETGGAERLAEPTPATDAGSVELEADEPVLPNPQALAPMEPQAQDEVSISTEPAQPPAPVLEVVEGAFDDPDQPEPAADAPEVTTALPAAPEATTQVEVPEQASAVPSQDPPAEVDEAPALPATAQDEPRITPVAPPPTVVARTPPPAEEHAVDTEDAPAPQVSAGSSIGTPAVPLTDRTGGVVVNRPVTAAAPEVQVAEDDPLTPDTLQADQRPIERNAQAFDVTGDKPLMSIVLIDDGSTVTQGAAGLAALRSFPYPLTFAVDTAKPDATERMALFRKEGFEVLAMVDLPEGALPSDAETTFAVTLPKFDAAVGVLEGVKGGFQGSREVADQVTEIMGQAQLGLVTQDKGLNTMPKLARKGGVPADPVFRDFDSKDQSATVIRRFLDQAAFKAGQEGAVIMLGRLRPDTITALLQWGLQDRASQVTLVPVSAVLLREE